MSGKDDTQIIQGEHQKQHEQNNASKLPQAHRARYSTRNPVECGRHVHAYLLQSPIIALRTPNNHRVITVRPTWPIRLLMTDASSIIPGSSIHNTWSGATYEDIGLLPRVPYLTSFALITLGTESVLHQKCEVRIFQTVPRVGGNCSSSSSSSDQV